MAGLLQGIPDEYDEADINGLFAGKLKVLLGMSCCAGTQHSSQPYDYAVIYSCCIPAV